MSALRLKWRVSDAHGDFVTGYRDLEGGSRIDVIDLPGGRASRAQLDVIVTALNEYVMPLREKDIIQWKMVDCEIKAIRDDQVWLQPVDGGGPMIINSEHLQQ